MSDKTYTVVAHARDLFNRWMAVNPLWENDYTEILHVLPNDCYHCPVTGAAIYIRRQGFMLRVTIKGYGNGLDASRCASILSGKGDIE
jgi:hypothetical protein